MLSVRGPGSRLCDGVTRREALRVGGLSALGLSLPGLLAARELASPAAGGKGFGRAKACIILWMTGGPSQHETWDPKPDAPAEIRGPFRSIPTRLPGLRVCEHMPRTAGMADKLCVLRGFYTNNPGHAGGTYEMLTGMEHPGGKGNENIKTSRTDSPTLGSIVKRFRPAVPGVPASVVLPQPVANVPEWPGQDAGFLGSEWDPWLLRCDPSAPNFHLPELTLPAEVSAERLAGRRSLLDQVSRQVERWQRQSPTAGANRHTQQALDLLSGARVRRAFDLGREATALRDRFGRHQFGQGCLLARRLIEAGVRLVQLNWFREPNQGNGWDVHWGLEEELKSKLMPPMDQGYTALLEDLDRRGLLGETLVVWMGEMGRTPKLEYVPGHEKEGVGRNHWGGVFSIALAGGGIRAGQVYGASDKNGAYPKDGPVTPADLTATLFHCLGIAPDTEIRDRLDRPHPISRGRALGPIFG
jgi:hypothetical protein